MAKFMYLFRTDASMVKTFSPEVMQQLMQKWMNWKDELEKNGHVKMLGERLDWSGKVVRGPARTVTDGPYVEVKDSIQGYVLVEARDTEQAAELAKGCPILDGGGSVEVRQIITG